MNDQDIRDLVIKHDAHIDTLATSIEQLANGVGATNKKLEDVIDVITQQNILFERVNNMDKDIAESFTRAKDRIKVVEDTIKEQGCELAKDLNREKDTFGEKIVVANKRIKDLEELSRTYVPGPMIRWAAFVFLTYSITFGVYVVTELHTIDKRELKCEIILGTNDEKTEEK